MYSQAKERRRFSEEGCPKIVKVPHPSRVLCQRMGLLTRSRSNAPCGDSRLGCRRKLHEPGVYKKLSTPIASCYFLTNGHCHWGVYPRAATVAPPSRRLSGGRPARRASSNTEIGDFNLAFVAEDGGAPSASSGRALATADKMPALRVDCDPWVSTKKLVWTPAGKVGNRT